MKAIVRSRYGTPDLLRLDEVPQPRPAADEVLVRIRASSVNSADLEYLKGMSLVRMAAPIRPAHRILGSDIAGIVAEVGRDVAVLAVGDEVFADLTELGFGAFAEYVAVPGDALAPMPAGLSFEQAASVPSAAVIALQGLRRRQVEPGQRVLVNGAGGGMGTFAVQLAKVFGAEVTAVDRADKLELLRSIGADHVIDFEAQDYTAGEQRYDLILDVSAYRSLSDVRRALTEEGGYFVIGGSTPRVLRAALASAKPKARQRIGIVAGQANRREDIDELSGLLETGSILPIIEASYPLAETPAALRRLQAGLVKGKAVISV
jgi:NADPH:quinone reductase-like Zn-dependent oxidoreductase